MIDIPYFADLHCHPTMKPFRQVPQANIFDNIDTQGACQELNWLTRPAAKNIVKVSQTNIMKCQQGKLRLMFASIHAPERKFFDLKDWVEFMLEFSANDQTVKLGVCMTGFDRSVVEGYIDAHRKNKDQAIHYFDETQREYEYLVMQAKQNECIGIAGDYEELQRILSTPDSVAIIPTIEGMHSLAIFTNFEQQNLSFDQVNDTSDPYYQHFATQYQINIGRIKSWGGGNHAPFFITFTHYFWNLLCGHAKSVESFAMSQSFNLDKGFSALGKVAVQALLSRENGRRILVDTKHMSVASRRDFYDIWDHYKSQGDSFPIICSHAALTGKATLSDLEASYDKGHVLENEYFNTWSINLCDEDVRYIHQSGGLLGLMFHDERMPGGLAKQAIEKAKALPDAQERYDQMRNEYLRLWMVNALQAVRAINDVSAWDILCIGSDYDGILNGFDIYEDVACYPDLQLHLFQYLHNPLPCPFVEGLQTKEDIKKLYFGLTPEQIMEKVLYKNVDNFMMRYYNNYYLKQGKAVNLMA
ncbi:amidohydrolase family protein [Microscilla marina]|uniref:Membrane dipeptidase (Peptidase family M19) n=1 Tax=Microscilla marina ATCC 23134 TaxID=313606 RepID=A1ZDB6_MICM2|nr:hypothetical protein [Microscilla marina]EAY31655.1 hypothetical protein M23134_05161 [Microscilla marina ATCC 23134]